jgi:serine/threonine protein phosphatase PrpC
MSDVFAQKFATEMKRIFKERVMKQGKKLKAAEDFDGIAQASDPALIQHALRRTFLQIDKQLGLQAFTVEAKAREKSEKDNYLRTSEARAELQNETMKRRKHSSTFETPLTLKMKKSVIKKQSIGSRQDDFFKIQKRQESVLDPSVRPRASNSKHDLKNISESKELFEKLEETTAQSNGNQEIDNGNDSDSDEENLEEQYLNLMDNGPSALVAFLAQQQLYLASCGDSMAVICRNGTAVPIVTRHTLFSFQSTYPHKPKNNEENNSESRDRKKTEGEEKHLEILPDTQKEKDSPNNEVSNFTHFARKELLRIRHCSGYISRDGLISDKTLRTRAFGHFGHLPLVNSAPFISVTDLSEQDEFLIIASGAFWKTIHHQAAVDIARLKSDDALEAAMVLRDFAMAYSRQATFSCDEESEVPEEKSCLQSSSKYGKSFANGLFILNVIHSLINSDWSDI